MSGDFELEYFPDGIVDEIISELSNYPVAARGHAVDVK
jgi:hypothetical protein